MISITSKSPYAVLALAELARSNSEQPVPIGELARKRDVPVQFLEQLFAVLRRGGIVSSQRGVKGGYRFAREPSTEAACKVLARTTIADVLEREMRDAGASMYHI
ncbi:MAG: Rrf2 family transcriptional regulator [Solirubrobacteraceae bacterium]